MPRPGSILEDPVGIGSKTIETCAVPTVRSTTQGVLFPAMTTAQRNAIASPLPGLTIYNTTTNKLNLWTGAAWEVVTSA